jgi:glycine cleavage system aminomethyltransferase T
VALQSLFDALHQFRVGYDAQLHKRTLQRGLLSLIGPGCDAALANPPGPTEHDHHAATPPRRHAATLRGYPVRLIRTDLGVDLLCESEHTSAVSAALVAAGASAIEEAAAEAVRRQRPRIQAIGLCPGLADPGI